MLERYLDLIRSFVDEQITPETFEVQYIDLWHETIDEETSPAAEMIIGDLFNWVDGFSDDPDLSPTTYVDGATLREKAKIALEQLNAYLSQ